MCPMGKLQLNNGEEIGRQPGPNAQQGDSRQNSGGRPKPKPRVLFPPQDDEMSYMFIEAYKRPKPNSAICPEPHRRIRFCISQPCWFNDRDLPFLLFSVLTMKPKMSIDAEVLLYADLHPLGCLDDKFGYCFLVAEVAYASVSALLSWKERKKSEPNIW